MILISSIEISRDIGLAHFQRSAAIDQICPDLLKSGVFFVLAPKFSKSKAVESLDVGGILPAGDSLRSGALIVRAVRNTVFNLAQLVQRILHSESAMDWCFREPYAGAAPVGSKLEQIGESHYARMNLSADADLLQLAEVIDDHRESWSFFMFCQLSEARESFIRAGVEFMVVSAYDGESFCCWVDEQSAFAKALLGYEGELPTAAS